MDVILDDGRSPPDPERAAAPGERGGRATQPGRVDNEDDSTVPATVAPATESALMRWRRERRDAKRAAAGEVTP